MDCGTPPGGPAEVGESVEEETEATEVVRRGGRDAIAAAAAAESADGRRHGEIGIWEARQRRRARVGCQIWWCLEEGEKRGSQQVSMLFVSRVFFLPQIALHPSCLTKFNNLIDRIIWIIKNPF